MPTDDHNPRDALPAGAIVRDYTLEAVIGHGGFGIVYRAQHGELCLPVAIKEFLPIELAVREGAIVKPRSGADSQAFEDGLRRFRDEARALIQFRSHDSIVSCREFFRENGTAYLVMEYEDGWSLAEVLARREAEGHPFRESDLLAVTLPLLNGLDLVHRAGMLHRDIKPSNILIRRRDERPVLIDFGAAKQVVAKRSKSAAPYTEGYAAPEQIAGAGKLGPWTDMYGVGAVMWRMVAGGQRPWEPPNPLRAESRAIATVRGAKDPLPTSGELGAGRFSPRVLEAIDRCLQLDEKERMKGCEELLESLEGTAVAPEETEASKARPGSLQPSGSQTELPRWSQGTKRGLGIATASLAGGLLLGLVLPSWIPVTDVAEPDVTEVAPDIADPDTDNVVTSANSECSDDGQAEGGTGIDQANGAWHRFRDCQVCPEMVEVPTGVYVMGASANVAGSKPNDWPMHRVEIEYRLGVGVYEVTFEEWDACVNGNGCNAYLPDDMGWGRTRRPVIDVTWDEAQTYAKWLSSKTGQKYRLLSEAEWEYVARAGTRTRFHFGAEPARALLRIEDECTATVGSFPPNAFGLHDVHGNVAEWVADCWNESYEGAPTDGSAWTNGDCRYRVTRGGSWNSWWQGLGSASRNREVAVQEGVRRRSRRLLSPNTYYTVPQHRSSGLGFRIARTLEP